MRQRLRKDEGGWVLVTAVVLLAVMLTIGLAAMQLVTSDSHRSREQRETESAFNVDEGVLYAQSMVLGQNWPSLTTHPYAVANCSSAGTATAGCPDATRLADGSDTAQFTNVDQKAGSTSWKTKVRDNGGALAGSYDPTKADLAQGACPGPCSYDFNADGELWVQAQTTSHGHPRNVVARMRLEKLTENLTPAAVTAGAVSVTNNGNHGGTPIIDATGSSVNVRCSQSNNTCINANDGQIAPAVPSPLQSGAPVPPNLMTSAQLARFKQRAITDGHYFAGCPSNSSDLSGTVVWVEGCADPPGPPNFSNSLPTTTCAPPNGMSGQCINSELSPGLLIWHCGRADFQGSFTYRGTLYMVNDSDGTCPATLPQEIGDNTCHGTNADDDHDVLNTNGGFGVWGAVAVDGPACIKVGSNNLQIKFDSRVWDALQSYGTVGLVQNTWRELDPKAFY